MMSTNDPREKIQQEARSAWLQSKRKNTIVLPTGSGKSKVAIDLIKELNPESVLLLTNSTDLRDNNWKAEFEKWDYPWDKVISECYQTVYRWQGRDFDFVVADEVDFIADQYMKFFVNNNCGVILGLTGYVTEEKEQFLEQFAPVCFKSFIEDLQQDNVLNKSEFIVVEYPLSQVKDIEQNLKKGGTFKTSENDNYKYWDKQFQQASIIKSQLEKKYKLLNDNYEVKADWKAADWKFKIAASKRKKLLHTSPTTIQVAKNVIDNIHSRPGNKILVFSTLTDVADKLPNPFHGKSEDDISGIVKLNNGEVNTLSVVKKVTRGTNLIGVNYLVRVTYDGSEVDLSQSLGRLMRLRVDQTAKYVILVPYYHDFIKTAKGGYENRTFYTQAERWREKMMQALSNPTIRTIRLDNTLKIKEGIQI